MFTDLSFVGMMAFKPFLPHLPPVQPFRIFTWRRIILPSLVSMVNVWISHCSQLLGTGLNVQLFLNSWIIVLLFQWVRQDYFIQKRDW